MRLNATLDLWEERNFPSIAKVNVISHPIPRHSSSLSHQPESRPHFLTLPHSIYLPRTLTVSLNNSPLLFSVHTLLPFPPVLSPPSPRTKKKTLIHSHHYYHHHHHHHYHHHHYYYHGVPFPLPHSLPFFSHHIQLSSAHVSDSHAKPVHSLALPTLSYLPRPSFCKLRERNEKLCSEIKWLALPHTHPLLQSRLVSTSFRLHHLHHLHHHHH